MVQRRCRQPQRRPQPLPRHCEDTRARRAKNVAYSSEVCAVIPQPAPISDEIRFGSATILALRYSCSVALPYRPSQVDTLLHPRNSSECKTLSRPAKGPQPPSTHPLQGAAFIMSRDVHNGWRLTDLIRIQGKQRHCDLERGWQSQVLAKSISFTRPANAESCQDVLGNL